MTCGRAIVVVLGLVAGLVAPPPTGAQVFLASRSHAGLAVTPLFIAAVSNWNVERHEVEIAVVDGVVQNLQVRIGRVRSARPSPGSFERTA